MRLRNFLIVAIGLAVLLAVGARAEAQEMGQVIEEIEDLQAKKLDVLRTLGRGISGGRGGDAGRRASTRVGGAGSGDGRRCGEGA